MFPFISFLAVACAILAYLLHSENKKRMKLFEDYSDMMARVELAAEEPEEFGPLGESLTIAGVEKAVKYIGYVPNSENTWVSFMAQGERYISETSQLPRLHIIKDYQVDCKDWEMDLLRHAAHLMSDDMVMGKAIFFDEENGKADLRFLVTAMDRNYASLRNNLVSYMSIIEEGRGRMHEIYENLVKEKRDAALALNPVLPQVQPEKKIMS